MGSIPVAITELIVRQQQEIDRLNGELSEVRAEIERIYKTWCGRDYMHLPLSEAVGAVMEATSNPGCPDQRVYGDTVQGCTDRDSKHHQWAI